MCESLDTRGKLLEVIEQRARGLSHEELMELVSCIMTTLPTGDLWGWAAVMEPQSP